MRWDLCRGTKALEIDGAQAHFYSASSANIGAICWQESRMCIDGSASDYPCTGFAKRFGRSVQTSQILTVLSTKRVLFNDLTCVGLSFEPQWPDFLTKRNVTVVKRDVFFDSRIECARSLAAPLWSIWLHGRRSCYRIWNSMMRLRNETSESPNTCSSVL